VCCNVLQCFVDERIWVAFNAPARTRLPHGTLVPEEVCSVLQCVATCCSVLQRVAVFFVDESIRQSPYCRGRLCVNRSFLCVNRSLVCVKR